MDAVNSAVHQARKKSSAFAKWLLCWIIAFKAIYLLIVAIVAWFWNDFDTDNFRALTFGISSEPPTLFECHFETWDSAHYLYLSKAGYHPNTPSIAFYPLWPFLIRWSAAMFGGKQLIIGLALANLFSAIAWKLFHKVVAMRWQETAANWSLLFLIAFPGGLFFQFNYSESVFLFFTLLLWLGLNDRHFGVAGIAAFLLPLTRAVGLGAVLPLTVHVMDSLSQWRRYRRQNISVPYISVKSAKEVCYQVFPLVMLVAGWILYLSLMRHWTGGALEGIGAQKYFGVHSLSNLINLPKFIIAFLTPTQWHEYIGSLLDRAAFLLLLLVIPFLWKLDKKLLPWIFVLGVLPAMSSMFTSYIRYVSCAFPMFVALGVLLSKPGWTWLRYGLLAAFGIIHVLLVWRFVNCRWAG